MKRFDTTPTPFFLQAMRNQTWNVTGAIAELVDNSFGPGRGNADHCDIIYDPTHRTLTVLDDGVGMPSIGRLFQLGNTIGRSPGDIGLYGSGGTMAILWLADTVTVMTIRDGRVSSDKVTWQEWIDVGEFPKIDESWAEARVANTLPSIFERGHGTGIIIKLAPERGRLNPSNLRRDLSKIYSPGIRAGKQIHWTTLGKGGGTDRLTDPIVLPGNHDKVINFDFAITYGDEDLPVIGQVGLIEGLTINDAGVHVGYGSRVITKTKDCFASPDGTETFAATTVTGWLDLGDGWQPYLSTTKNAINDRPLWDALMGYVFESIRDLLVEAADEKLTLELENIRLSLQTMFDGKAIVTVPREKVDLPDIDVGPSDEPGERDSGEPDTPETDDSDVDHDKPAKAEIQIVTADDATLDGVLCQAERAGSTITILVNRDHEVVQLAMQQRPINRALLTLLAVNEIANVMAPDVELIASAFKPKIATLLTTIDDPIHRERKLLRQLIDGVKAGNAA